MSDAAHGRAHVGSACVHTCQYGGRERCRASVLFPVKPLGSGAHPSPPVRVLGVGSGPWCQQGARFAGCPLSSASARPKKRQQSVPCSSPTGTTSCGTELQVVLEPWPPTQLLAGLGGGSGDQGTRGKDPWGGSPKAPSSGAGAFHGAGSFCCSTWEPAGREHRQIARPLMRCMPTSN